MNPLYQAVVQFQQRLNSAGIESAVIGGIAVSMWARPRATEDLLIYKIISTRPIDQIDVENIVRRQGNKLDDQYVLHWQRLLEQALDDSTLVATYRRLRRQ